MAFTISISATRYGILQNHKIDSEPHDTNKPLDPKDFESHKVN